MELSNKKIFIILLSVVFVFVVAISFMLIDYQFAVNKTDLMADVLDSLNLVESPKQLEAPDDILQAVYSTGWSAGSRNHVKYLNNLFSTTQINAVVIDIKDASGIVSYRTNAPMAKKYKAYYPQISNIDALIKNLHSQGVYVIGRIVVFEDITLAKNRPDLAVYDTAKTTDLASPVLWGNKNGVHWVDPASEEVWEYNIEIAKDALSHGFDEINFDYIRFPTDGKTSTMGFPIWNKKVPRHLVIKSFFANLRESLPDAKISADLFGQVTTNKDDMGIGQYFEDSLEYFDYVSPMIYPSHYAKGFLGFDNPAEHPYEIVKYAMDAALTRKDFYYEKKNLPKDEIQTEVKLAEIRPWIQDFDIGANYDAPMIVQQIKAVTDSTGDDYVGFLLWNPLNRYTSDAVKIQEVVLD